MKPVYTVLIALAVLCSSVAWLCHVRYEAGVQQGQIEGDIHARMAEDKQHVAERDSETCALALRQVNTEKALAVAVSKAAVERENAAADRLQAAERAAARQATDFAAKLKAASARPECSGLKEQLCAAVPFPY